MLYNRVTAPEDVLLSHVRGLYRLRLRLAFNPGGAEELPQQDSFSQPLQCGNAAAGKPDVLQAFSDCVGSWHSQSCGTLRIEAARSRNEVLPGYMMLRRKLAIIAGSQ